MKLFGKIRAMLLFLFFANIEIFYIFNITILTNLKL